MQKYGYKDCSYNVYELAHLAKEWAWKQGFVIQSFKTDYVQYTSQLRKMGEKQSFQSNFNTEYEAIFDSCDELLRKIKFELEKSNV